NELLTPEPGHAVASVLHGGYFQGGYNVLSRRNTRAALIPYLRYEKVNTQADLESGLIGGPSNDRTIWTIGLQYLPIPHIVLKGDYQNENNRAGTGLNQWNIDLGYSF